MLYKGSQKIRDTGSYGVYHGSEKVYLYHRAFTWQAGTTFAEYTVPNYVSKIKVDCVASKGNDGNRTGGAGGGLTGGQGGNGSLCTSGGGGTQSAGGSRGGTSAGYPVYGNSGTFGLGGSGYSGGAGGAGWYGGGGCSALTELHFGAANETAIKSSPGWSTAWGRGAGNVTIYFDL